MKKLNKVGGPWFVKKLNDFLWEEKGGPGTEVPRWGPGAQPLLGGLGDEVPQKLNAFLNL